jgi:hypothetical protein
MTAPPTMDVSQTLSDRVPESIQTSSSSSGELESQRDVLLSILTVGHRGPTASRDSGYIPSSSLDFSPSKQSILEEGNFIQPSSRFVWSDEPFDTTSGTNALGTRASAEHSGHERREVDENPSARSIPVHERASDSQKHPGPSGQDRPSHHEEDRGSTSSRGTGIPPRTRRPRRARRRPVIEPPSSPTSSSASPPTANEQSAAPTFAPGSPVSSTPAAYTRHRSISAPNSPRATSSGVTNRGSTSGSRTPTGCSRLDAGDLRSTLSSPSPRFHGRGEAAPARETERGEGLSSKDLRPEVRYRGQDERDDSQSRFDRPGLDAPRWDQGPDLSTTTGGRSAQADTIAPGGARRGVSPLCFPLDQHQLRNRNDEFSPLQQAARTANQEASLGQRTHLDERWGQLPHFHKRFGEVGERHRSRLVPDPPLQPTESLLPPRTTSVQPTYTVHSNDFYFGQPSWPDRSSAKYVPYNTSAMQAQPGVSSSQCPHNCSCREQDIAQLRVESRERQHHFTDVLGRVQSLERLNEAEVAKQPITTAQFHSIFDKLADLSTEASSLRESVLNLSKEVGSTETRIQDSLIVNLDRVQKSADKQIADLTTELLQLTIRVRDLARDRPPHLPDEPLRPLAPSSL